MYQDVYTSIAEDVPMEAEKFIANNLSAENLSATVQFIEDAICRQYNNICHRYNLPMVQ